MALFSGQPRIRDGIATRAVVRRPPRFLGSAEGFPQVGRGRVNVALALTVRLPGRPPYDVELRSRAPSDKRPYPGQILPVTVDPRDPMRVRVDWERCPTLSERADRLIERQRFRDG